MRKHDQQGAVLGMASIVALVILLVAAVAFAAVTYKDRNHYKTESDKISAAAVAVAKQQQAAADQRQFDQDAKKPFKSYSGPQAYGSISFQYPKTWSGYVDETSSSEPINGYFYPDIVPGLQSGRAYALRVELVSSSYSQVLQQFTSSIKLGTVKASAYLPAKLAKVTSAQVGTLLKGAISQNLQGTMLVIRVRDKTLEISTQSTTFNDDFTNTVLKSLTYNP